MFSIPTMIVATSILSFIIMLVSSTISKKTAKDREKSSPFECGFDPKTSARSPFSLRFFLLAIIFLIFDVEIVLLIPIPSLLEPHTHTYTMCMVSVLVSILILGLLFEWKTNALDWAQYN